jgi:non-specific serine/threonine protein kinase
MTRQVAPCSYRFGGRFELQPAERRLLVGGKAARLNKRAFDVLLILVERAGQLVTKDELLERVWAKLVVEENNVDVQITKLRKLLGRKAIENERQHGYRFTLPVDAISAPPALSLDKSAHKGRDARANNLPAQMSLFIGRENEIRAIRTQLADGQVRLLTLSGVAGTGKTRLALQAAADLVDEFEDGVFFVPLAAISDPALVLPTIAKVFDVREAADRSLQEQLQAYLRDKEMLLVLDNFEHVIDAAPRVTDLLTAAPRLKVCVTSREVLRLSGETDYPVPPLSLPDPKRLPPLERLTQYEAVALFTERAMAVKPSFKLTNENTTAVVEICHRLDGLPLSIELAAARVRVLPPQRMLAELSDRLTFLIGRARDLSARQQTLRGAIDWSHDLLTGDEQKLFRRLAVFVGGCALDGIEAICDLENDLPVLETIELLVGKSLVKHTEASGEPRFAMLETIREYASERLMAAGEADRVRHRHRDYFLALAEEAEPKLTGALAAEWLQRLEVENGNLLAGLDWSLVEAGSGGGLRLCAALRRFWWTRGHLSEGREWCVRFLGKAGPEERTPERANALNAAGQLAFYQGDYHAARAQHEESLAARRQLGDRKGVAGSLINLGNVALEQGDYPSARTLYEESLTNWRELGDRTGTATALNNLGIVACDQRDYCSARAFYEESLAIARELGHRGGTANQLHNLGHVAYEQGDYPAARALFEESLAIERALGNRGGIADSLISLGDVGLEQADYPTAAARHQEGLVIGRELGDQRGIAFALEGRAAVIAALGGPLRAARMWGAAERLRAEIGCPQTPSGQASYDRRVATARKALCDNAAFECAWQEGRALTLEQAIELALMETAESPLPRPPSAGCDPRDREGKESQSATNTRESKTRR